MRHAFLKSLLLLVFLSACETAPKTDVAVRFFNDVAFFGTPGGYPLQGKVMLETNYAEHKMYRWEEEIKVGLSGLVTPEFRQQVETTMRRISDVSGRSARFVSSDAEEPNFLVEFVGKENFNVRKTESVPCYAQYFGEENISKISIKISVDKPKLARHCVAHEIFHGFGFSHSDLLRSVISEKTAEEELTAWDEMALKTLYDPRLESGMTRLQAMPIARRIILEILSTTGTK